MCYFQLMPGTSYFEADVFSDTRNIITRPSDKSVHWNARVKDDSFCYSSCCGEIPVSVFHPGKAGEEKGHKFALGGVGGWEGAVSKGALGWQLHRAAKPPDPHGLENRLKKRESWQQENIICDLYTTKLTIKPWTREAFQSEILGEKGKAKCSYNPCS